MEARATETTVQDIKRQLQDTMKLYDEHHEVLSNIEKKEVYAEVSRLYSELAVALRTGATPKHTKIV